MASGSSPKTSPTRWTLIVRAQGTGPEARAALEELLRAYSGFVLFLIRVNRPPPDAAVEDLAQEYVTRILQRNDIAKLDEKRGSFRAWLRTSVRYFLLNQWDRYRSRPQIDPRAYEAFQNSTPEDELCERAFLAQVIERALVLTRARTDDPTRFDKIARFLPGPQADIVEHGPVAAELGLSPGAFSKLLFDTRKRFNRNVDLTLWETLDLALEFDDEQVGPQSAAGLRALRAEKWALLRSLEPSSGGVVRCPE